MAINGSPCRNSCLPQIGSTRVDDAEASAIQNVLIRIRLHLSETARRFRQRLVAVLAATGFAETQIRCLWDWRVTMVREGASDEQFELHVI